MRVAFVNDTSLFSSHFGCQLVGQVFREQFKRVGLDLVLSLPKEFAEERYQEVLQSVDLVVVNGEGSIHHGRNKHLVGIAEKYPSVLLNCVYQDNPDYPALKDFLLITARESMSANYINTFGVNCEVVPDAIFASSLVRSFPKGEATHDLGVTDNVKKDYVRFGPFKRKIKGDFPAHGVTPAEYIKKLASYQRICSGRFHATVICSIIGIPFSAWESNTWKMRGMLMDMGVPELIHDRRDNALNSVPTKFNSNITDFVDKAKIRIESTFDRVAEIAKGLSSK